MRRLLPHPLLTLTLVLVWLALVNSFSLGTLVMAVILGVVIPILTSPYWPGVPVLKKPLSLAFYCLLVFWDIVLANIAVAKIVLFRPRDRIRSAWVVIPLDVTSPEAISMLAGTITLTPGTVSAMLSADGRSLLVHCLDTDDPAAVCAEIKHRYERRLLEIFP
ncbi:putative monovalent cation/H+ antiporter subunit E [Oceaniovalibus guishaninsula JLT2003]|uniref:Putative monovalent cation/H+ antiporter subunit E n=1 Tax=Oceaniovalibus guishaninsula JLT2003 TaxID=1231392 RepID=K2HD31_9RHOB|nr:putative monovalent cation/H+ antiporter subunit E [Oceaniovalibus guishaninsula JLT2003]